MFCVPQSCLSIVKMIDAPPLPPVVLPKLGPYVCHT